jgi:hypothetical protein
MDPLDLLLHARISSAKIAYEVPLTNPVYPKATITVWKLAQHNTRGSRYKGEPAVLRLETSLYDRERKRQLRAGIGELRISEDGATLGYELQINKYINPSIEAELRTVCDEFCEMLCPSSGHESLYGSGDSSYEY